MRWAKSNIKSRITSFLLKSPNCRTSKWKKEVKISSRAFFFSSILFFNTTPGNPPNKMYSSYKRDTVSKIGLVILLFSSGIFRELFLNIRNSLKLKGKSSKMYFLPASDSVNKFFK